jgi:hypothetical protein
MPSLAGYLPQPDFSKLIAPNGVSPYGGSPYAGPAAGSSVASVGASAPAPGLAPAIQLSGAFTPGYSALINNDPSSRS